jgi:hypothetical protein
MRTIYKYPLLNQEVQKVTIPKDSEIISVGLDPMGILCLWATVDTDPRIGTEELTIAMVPTGYPFPFYKNTHFRFLGTVRDTPYMWHIFQIWEGPE